MPLGVLRERALVFTIEAQDNQFSTAVGRSIGPSGRSSKFDSAPSQSSNLQITTNEGDIDPRLFEVGDTYDVSWSTSEGDFFMEDAVVIRSDAAGGGGVVVFEGADAEEGAAQVVWTPDFDLEGWYWSNYHPRAEPRFYNSDQNPDYTHSFVCFAGGTQIATPSGLVPAGQLKVGASVCTWGGPTRRILWTARRRVSARGACAPVCFAPGSLGNFNTLRLSQQHRVLVRLPRVISEIGGPEVLVPAKALVDGKDITLKRGGEITYVHFLLDRHDLVIAEGAPCETLLPGPETRGLIQGQADKLALSLAVQNGAYHPVRPIVSGKVAKRAGRLRLREGTETVVAY